MYLASTCRNEISPHIIAPEDVDIADRSASKSMYKGSSKQFPLSFSFSNMGMCTSRFGGHPAPPRRLSSPSRCPPLCVFQLVRCRQTFKEASLKANKQTRGPQRRDTRYYPPCAAQYFVTSEYHNPDDFAFRTPSKCIVRKHIQTVSLTSRPPLWGHKVWETSLSPPPFPSHRGPR